MRIRTITCILPVSLLIIRLLRIIILKLPKLHASLRYVAAGTRFLLILCGALELNHLILQLLMLIHKLSVLGLQLFQVSLRYPERVIDTGNLGLLFV
jgi:hypothetical protein